MKKHIANLRISFDLFRDVFHLPDDTDILAVSIDNTIWRSLVITIENSELPEVNEGEIIPISVPTYHRTNGDNGEIIRVERLDWGIR